MSSVTNLIILGMDFSEEAENKLNEYGDIGVRFTRMNENKVAGTKCLEATVYMGALNYIDWNQLIRLLEDIQRTDNYANPIQILVKDHDEDQWTLFNLQQLRDRFYQFYLE